MTQANENIYAAIDLGSNSFHLIVAEQNDEQLRVVDKLKDMVRMAGGLGPDLILSDDVITHSLDCLERFGQRLKDIPADNIRAVGTNTLRQARNATQFLSQARARLGHPIEIISGREEARLIYVGVANTLFNEKDFRLVVDIGGGSTEIIIGKGQNPIYTESLYMGCVNMTNRYFADGVISKMRLNSAIVYAQQEVRPIANIYRQHGWDLALGSSGTISAIQDVVIENGWSQKGITAEALQKLKNKVLKFEHIDDIDIEGLSNKRKPVIVGGLAVLLGVFEILNIEQMDVSHGALREGIIYDLVGRLHDRDIREQSVQGLCDTFQLDTQHSRTIANTAAAMFVTLRKPLKLTATDLKLVKWAIALHELGLTIAHTQYHKHGAYIIANADLSGFSRGEQNKLATLVRFHRRKLNKQEMLQAADDDGDKLVWLCVIVRISILLHRSRNRNSVPEIQLSIDEQTLTIEFPEGWLSEHPLTTADLDTEKDYLGSIKIKLKYS